MNPPPLLSCPPTAAACIRDQTRTVPHWLAPGVMSCDITLCEAGLPLFRLVDFDGH